MTSDEKARTLDGLVESYRDARTRRENTADPLAVSRRSKSGSGQIGSHLLSKDGQKKLRQALSALKAERDALKALKKFARKHGRPRATAMRDGEASQAKADSAAVLGSGSPPPPPLPARKPAVGPATTGRTAASLAAVARAPRRAAG